MSDLKELFRSLKDTKPPYKCLFNNCPKSFKSLSAGRIHMHKFHNCRTKSMQHMKKRASLEKLHKNLTMNPELVKKFSETEDNFEVVSEGKMHFLSINESIPVFDNASEDEELQALLRTTQPKPKSIKNHNRWFPVKRSKKTSSPFKLPEPSFRIKSTYTPRNVPPLPTNYYRFEDKPPDETTIEVEYDMDDEDNAWLSITNEHRRKKGFSEVPEDILEMLVDTLEKESYFLSQSIAEEQLASIDENAVCCICNDGECDDSNAILFCDMCNLPVHQECYGVPFIPEGQWLCRKCTHSPSRLVECVLCPNKDGAFKQTDDKRWAHVICALWIPEVGFTNPNFLEPVDSIKKIPRARWKLCCYICKKKNSGACIQCKKNSCYTAFHVTCAQKEGLFMEMKAIKANGIGDASYEIEKSAFCSAHTPKAPSAKSSSCDEGENSSDRQTDSSKGTLTELSVSVTSIPNISPDTLLEHIKKYNIADQRNFVKKVIAYWKLKRQSRGGAPLLRRLQVTLYPQLKQEGKFALPIDKDEILQVIKIRQSFEKARLLLEMLRKREKLKRSMVEMQKQETYLRLQPFIQLLLRTIDHLQSKDKNYIFAQPVDINLITDYLDFVKKPMDFSTMRKKAQSYHYNSFTEFEEDFNLMLDNCLLYNAKDTVYYRVALEMQTQCARILQKAREEVLRNRFDTQTGLFSEDVTNSCDKNITDLEEKGSKNQIKESKPIIHKSQNHLKGTYHLISRSRHARQITLPVNLRCHKPGSRLGTDESDEENGIHTAALNYARKRTVLQHLKRIKKNMKFGHFKRTKAPRRKLRSSEQNLQVTCTESKVPTNLLAPPDNLPGLCWSYDRVDDSQFSEEETSKTSKNGPIKMELEKQLESPPENPFGLCWTYVRMNDSQFSKGETSKTQKNGPTKMEIDKQIENSKRKTRHLRKDITRSPNK